jgi:hypothetical protein
MKAVISGFIYCDRVLPILSGKVLALLPLAGEGSKSLPDKKTLR